MGRRWAELGASLVGCEVAAEGKPVGSVPVYTVVAADGEYVLVDRHHRGGLLDSRYRWHASSLRQMERVA